MIEVREVAPEVWRGMSESAHFTVFSETWSQDLEKIDFALIMINKESDDVVSYSTAQLQDDKSVYLQYGGVFPKYRGTSTTYKSFEAMLLHLKSKFKKITTLVENTNTPMLKFYMKGNFLITGMRYFKEHTYLENTYEH